MRKAMLVFSSIACLDILSACSGDDTPTFLDPWIDETQMDITTASY
jgi:hypothetical protein